MRWCATAAAIVSWSGAADAREAQRRQIDVEAGSLAEAIARLSRETGVTIGADGALPPVRTRAVHGHVSVDEALARLLAGSGYRAVQVGDSAWRIEREVRREPPPRKRPAPPPPPVLAAADEPGSAPPIVVTAAKRNQLLRDLPLSVDVVGLTTQQRHDVGGTGIIASSMEGMAMTALGPGRNRIFLRGISDSAFTGESQSTVAVVLDDARITYAAPDPDIRLVDMDRVEVIKGPQGSLYGVGALGGIYHLVTRRAQIDETSLAVSTGAETISGGGSGYSLSAVANLPVVTGRAALRVVGYKALRPGWVDTGANRNSNENHVSGVRAELGYDAGGGWRIDLTGFAQWLASKDSRYVYAPGARTRPAQLPEPHDNDLLHFAARVAGKIGGLDISASSGVTWHEVDDTLDATIGADSFGLADPQTLGDARKYRIWDNELRVSGKSRGVDWLIGVSHLRAGQDEGLMLTSTTGQQLGVDDDHRTAYDTALFADATVPLTSSLRVDLGGRLFHSVLIEHRQVAGDAIKREQNRTGLTPSAAISWTPHVNQLLFVRYGSAFRQGGADIGRTGQLRALRGDELRMIEAGWRQILADGGKLELGAWHAWWDNVQSDVLRPTGLVETANVGNAVIYGAEASFDFALGKGWRMQGGVNVTHSELVRDSLRVKISDRRLPVIPEYTLRTALRRDFTVREGVTTWWRAGLRYIGPARLSFSPALDRPMGKVLESRLEGHIDFARTDVTLAMDNVLGRSSDTFAYGNPLRFATMRQYIPQQPRTVSLTVMRRF